MYHHAGSSRGGFSYCDTYQCRLCVSKTINSLQLLPTATVLRSHGSMDVGRLAFVVQTS